MTQGLEFTFREDPLAHVPSRGDDVRLDDWKRTHTVSPRTEQPVTAPPDIDWDELAAVSADAAGNFERLQAEMD